MTRRSQRRTSQAPPQDPSPAPAADPANSVPAASPDVAASLPSHPPPPRKRPRTSAAAANKDASGAASAGSSSDTATVHPSLMTLNPETQQIDTAAPAAPSPPLPSRIPAQRKPPKRRIPSSDAEEEEERVVFAPPPEATNPPPEPGNAVLSVALDPVDTYSAPEPSAPAVPRPLDQVGTEVDRDSSSAIPLASPQDAPGPTKTPQPVTSLQAATPLGVQSGRAPAGGDDSMGATPVPVGETIGTPVAANLPLPAADQDLHAATSKEVSEETVSTEQQAAGTTSAGASSGSIAQPSPKPGQSPAGKPPVPKPNAARNPLNKIRSSKIAPGAPKPSSAGLKPTKSGAFNILEVLQPTAPAKPKPEQPVEARTAPPSLMPTQAEKEAEAKLMAAARIRERLARSDADSTSFDLLTQNYGIMRFEDEFREKVRRQHVEENNKYSGKHGLPRLTTFGSVFSLFPRSTGEGYEAP